MTRAETITALSKYKLEYALYNTMRQLHGARHGNINSPDDFSFENCAACDQILGIDKQEGVSQLKSQVTGMNRIPNETAGETNEN